MSEDRRMYLRFEPYSRGGAYYSTTDEDVQKALERCAAFKRGDIRLQETDKQPETEKERKEVNSAESAKEQGYTVVKSVQNCSDARIWLKDNFGDNMAFKSRSEILAAAQGHRVYFPNLKQ